jgi:hypothetical protein
MRELYAFKTPTGTPVAGFYGQNYAQKVYAQGYAHMRCEYTVTSMTTEEAPPTARDDDAQKMSRPDRGPASL